jgi:hypothetical protein
MQDLEKSEKAMHEKYTTVKVLPYHTMQYSLPYHIFIPYSTIFCSDQEQSNELEEEVSRLKTSLKNEERKLEDLNKLAKQLQEERGQVVDIIRQEFADRYESYSRYKKSRKLA